MSSPTRQMMNSRRLPPLPGFKGGSSPLPSVHISAMRELSPKPSLIDHSLSSQSLLDYNHHNDLTPTEMSPELITAYLNANPTFLESYILSNVSCDQLERLLLRRSLIEKQITGKCAEKAVQTLDVSATSPSRKDIFSKWKTTVKDDKRKMLQELTTNIQDDPNKSHILWELTACVASAVNADGFNLYLLDEKKENIYYLKQNSNNNSKTITCPIGPGTTVGAYVAHTNETLRVNDVLGDDRFPEGIIVDGSSAQSVLAQPIMNSSDDCVGVIELFRKVGRPPFGTEDEEISGNYLVWGGIAVYYAEMYTVMMKQKKLNEFLLNVTKSIFQDIVSMDTLIMKIMNFAKKLVHADRASLFLVDKLTRELYARIFDTGKLTDESHSPSTEREIRFPMDKGVAGYVASTGAILNIPDAYADDRFNRDVDLQTGYTTRTILCMPIYIRGNIIGVVQMVNKLNGTFTKSDEESFETFAVYCGLALHHAKLYDKIRRSEQKYKVALEVLSYHSQCSEQEVERLKDRVISAPVEDFTRYDFSPWAIDNDEKPLYVIKMFKALFDASTKYRYDQETLVKFTLTIRKNYRTVPYHNWAHAFSVAHAMFTVIRTTKNDFTPLESLVLFVACLCHDLDHRGKTNAFMVKSASPLAAIYSTSTMEHHHFNQTVSILQQDGHNVFRYLSPQEYKQALGKIKECILATDLALFFGNRAKLKELVDQKKFDPTILNHREMLMYHSMTAADLCSMYKPWNLQVKLVNIIMEEFWQQGDEEKTQGIQPIAMMDRAKAHQLPQSQVGFILGICLPCYELMAEVLPGSEPMAEGASANLKKWKELAESQPEKEEDSQTS